MSRLECIVGGVVFTTTVEVLTSIPDSFFCKALDDTWNSAKSPTLTINRDGTHFQHVLSYLMYGFLPRDPTGRCNIPKDVLELLSIEADFYGLPLLLMEIDQLVKFNTKGMKYFISTFYENSGHGGSLDLQEFVTYDEALAKYEAYKKMSKKPCLRKGTKDKDEDAALAQADGDDSEHECEVSGNKRTYNWDDYGQNIVVQETEDAITGKIMKSVFQDGNWKRPTGLELLCVPISGEKDKEGAVYTCELRTHCDERFFDW